LQVSRGGLAMSHREYLDVTIWLPPLATGVDPTK
jgi:hypothetical protein